MKRAVRDAILGHLGCLAHVPDKIDAEHVAAITALVAVEPVEGDDQWYDDFRACMTGLLASDCDSGNGYRWANSDIANAAEEARRGADAMAVVRASRARVAR